MSGDNRADASIGSTRANAFVLGNRGHGLRKWIIVSSCGSFHTVHFDGNGLCTIVTVREGFKLWVWGVPKSGAPLPTPAPPVESPESDGGEGWSWALFDDCDVFGVVLGPEDTMYVFFIQSLSHLLFTSPLIPFRIMPPGLRHAVFSISLDAHRPSSVVMSGSHFISEHTLPAMLEASISHSLWHDAWTNALHDDKIAHVAWMLHDLLMRRSKNAQRYPVTGINAFALITWGILAPWLISLPHQTAAYAANPLWLCNFDPKAYLTDRLGVSSLADAATNRMIAMLDQVGQQARHIYRELEPEDQEAFQQYYRGICEKLATEIIRRTEYNLAVSKSE